jgi:YHS domain-containing protein
LQSDQARPKAAVTAYPYAFAAKRSCHQTVVTGSGYPTCERAKLVGTSCAIVVFRAWLHAKEKPMVKDPVCGMQIDEKKAAGKSEYRGTTYYFCAAICKTKFDQNPSAYVKS